MKLAIGKSDFARVLGNVGRVVESRNTIPILSNVRLIADGGKLQVTATDLDIVATDLADADISAPGSVCVDAKLLSTIVGKVQGDVSLTLDKGSLIVKSGRSRFTLSTLPAEDFPDFPPSTYDAEFEIDLASAFAPCVHAISTDDARYYLQGIYFSGGASAVAAATDGHRLSKNLPGDLPDFAGVIVPKKIVGLLPKGGCHVSVSDSKIRIQAGSLTMISKLIDGTYPNIERIIPQNNEITFTVDRDEMMRAADRVVTISSERGRAVKLSLAPGSVALSARSEVGDAADEVVANYTGEPIDVSYNSAYLRDLLSVLPGGPVKFAVPKDHGGPGLLKSAAMEGWTGVLMPLRVT